MHINIQFHNLLFFSSKHGQDIELLPLDDFLSTLVF